MADVVQLIGAMLWDGDNESCAMCADAAATRCVGGEGWCDDCFHCQALNALTATLARAEQAEMRIDFLEGMVMSGQGEQMKLAADLLQAKIERSAERDARERAEALLKEAVEALQPFGEPEIDAPAMSDDRPYTALWLTIGDFRRARAILARIQEAKP